MLPDHDKINSLVETIGMYRLDRWPARASEQIEFLQAVIARFGANATVHLIEPDDGYPGYIMVKN